MSERYAVWLDRDVLSARGPEATEFLQGQLSQDVAAMAPGATAWSWVLAPTGKVDALVRVVRVAPDEWVLDTDAGWGDALATRLNRFKLRTKVEIQSLPWRVLGVRGAEPAPVGPDEVRADAWPGVPGYDVLGEAPQSPADMEVLAAEEYEPRRIEAGVPRMGHELTEKTIPAETGLIDLTVSFTKGCYTGQELVARIDSRGGHVPRHLRALELADRVEEGADLLAHGEPAGVVTSVARTADGRWIGLGYVRRAFQPPFTLEAGPGGPVVEVRA